MRHLLFGKLFFYTAYMLSCAHSPYIHYATCKRHVEKGLTLLLFNGDVDVSRINQN